MKVCKVEKKREVVDVDYEVCGNEYCCEKMKQWLSIGVRNRHHLRYSIDTGRFEIEVRESSGSYDYDYNHSGEGKAAYEDLNFCPFCGASVYNTSDERKIAPGSWTMIIKGDPEIDKKKHWWSK